jgi:hypothetical protein
MKYMLLIYDNEKDLMAMPEEAMQKLLNDYFKFTDEIKASGHYISADPLQPVHTATTVRIRNDKMTMTDGPFAETREQLGGYYLIEAKDLDEAAKIAARIPSARIGSIEVRPVQILEREG